MIPELGASATSAAPVAGLDVLNVMTLWKPQFGNGVAYGQALFEKPAIVRVWVALPTCTCMGAPLASVVA